MSDENKVASIDVHKKVLMVVVGSREGDAVGSKCELERRRFGATTIDLHGLSLWLRERGVKEAVMESTAEYWKPVWAELEPYMRLHLAQAFSNRAPKGRKHDFRDAERLRRRYVAGELILSFVPEPEQRAWRTVTRMKTRWRAPGCGSTVKWSVCWRRCGSSCPVCSAICSGPVGCAFSTPWPWERPIRRSWRRWAGVGRRVPAPGFPVLGVQLGLCRQR